jgi:hypothetical protein
MLEPLMEHSPETVDVSRPVATSHDDEPCTVSVPEASELFAASGLPRTERAIQRFCKKGELKCSFVETPFGSKYLITRSSIDRLIVQKQQAQKFAPDATVRDLPRPDATDRDMSRQEADVSSEKSQPNDHKRQGEPEPKRHDIVDNDMARHGATSNPDASDQIIEHLRGEIFDLKVDNAGKQNFIRQLVADRTQLMGDVKQISYELGVAQTQVAQLAAPRVTYDMPRPGATVAEEPVVSPETTTETLVVNKPASTLTTPEIPVSEKARPSLMRRIFG